MKANPQFSSLGKEFWANVRLISEEIGYTDVSKKQNRKAPTGPKLNDLIDYCNLLPIDEGIFMQNGDKENDLGRKILEFFKYRADIFDKRDAKNHKEELLLCDKCSAKKHGLNQSSIPIQFWENTHKLKINQKNGSSIKIPSMDEILKAFKVLNLLDDKIRDANDEIGKHIIPYFTYRAEKLNECVRKNLMCKECAKNEYEKLPVKYLLPKRNKQGKAELAYLTCIVNSIISANLNGIQCDYDPTRLTTITQDKLPIRTFARRVDGAFPSAINPVAIWEIKEYYNTTSFGSRVADGVYETLLDGLEIEELNASKSRKIEHILFIDAKYTWWDCGKPYLCRMIDMINMGCVDEVVFGKEIFDKLPKLVANWQSILKRQDK